MPYASFPRAFRPLSAAVAVATAVLLAGCAVGPDYHRPDTTIPAAFKEAPAGWKVAQPADRADRGPWWSVYGDSQLDALIGKLNASNQTIAQSAAAYRQARALVTEARAAYFPTVGLTASGTRSRTGRASSSSGSSTFGGGSAIGNSYSVGLDASWEPDLWGKVSRNVSAQRAGEAAAAADLANARLSQQALLAQTYFQLRTSDALQKLLDDTVKSYGDSLKLTQNQYAQGVAARADVIQAQTQLQSAQAASIDNGVARAIRACDRDADRRTGIDLLAAAEPARRGAAGHAGRRAVRAARAPARHRGRRAPRGRRERADRRRDRRVLPDAHAVGQRRLPELGMVAAVHAARTVLDGRPAARGDAVRRRPARRADRRGPRDLRSGRRRVPARGAHRVPGRRGQPRVAAHPRAGSRRAAAGGRERRAGAGDRHEPVQGRHGRLSERADRADHRVHCAAEARDARRPADGVVGRAREGARRRLGYVGHGARDGGMAAPAAMPASGATAAALLAQQ
jgi:hypothetical protein